MSVSPVNAPGNPLQSQEILDNLARTERKIHVLVIVGKIFQGIAVVGAGVAIGFSFVVGPVVLFSLIPAVAFGVLGILLVEDPDMFFQEGSNGMSRANSTGDSSQREPIHNGVRIPLGLNNVGANCWLNASLQLVMNAPRLKDRIAARSAECDQFFQSCAGEEQSLARVLQSTNSQRVREYLYRVKPEVELTGEQDPASFFEEVFSQGEGSSQPHSLYQFEQVRSGVLTQNEAGAPIIQHEPIIKVDFASNPGTPFDPLFRQFFNYEINPGDRIQRFFHEVPQDLLIKVDRIRQVLAGDRIRGEREPAELLMPEEITLPMDLCRGELEAEPRFACSGFVIHVGGAGSSIDSGHYVACVKRGNQWFYCDDARVRAISEDWARNLSRKGYFYHYSRA